MVRTIPGALSAERSRQLLPVTWVIGARAGDERARLRAPVIRACVQPSAGGVYAGRQCRSGRTASMSFRMAARRLIAVAMRRRVEGLGMCSIPPPEYE